MSDKETGKSCLPPVGKATVAPCTKVLADVAELVSPDGVQPVLPAGIYGFVKVRLKVCGR